jgi:hypothetical protein
MWKHEQGEAKGQRESGGREEFAIQQAPALACAILYAHRACLHQSAVGAAGRPKGRPSAGVEQMGCKCTVANM